MLSSVHVIFRNVTVQKEHMILAMKSHLYTSFIQVQVVALPDHHLDGVWVPVVFNGHMNRRFSTLVHKTDIRTMVYQLRDTFFHLLPVAQATVQGSV